MTKLKDKAKSFDYRKYKNMSTKRLAQALMEHVLSDIEDKKITECKKLGKSVNKKV